MHGEVIQGELAGPALWAIDELHHSTITPLSLSSRKTEPISGEELLSYSITSTKDHHEQMVVHSARLFTSHYVGSFLTSASWGASQKRVMIQIEPRFGWNSRVFCRLLAHAYGIHMPNQEASTKASGGKVETPDLLMALLWKATLEKALAKGQVPKEYRSSQLNTHVFRGKLMIGHHLRHNLVDQSRFYCQYRQLTMDVAINRAVRYTYDLLKRSTSASALKGLAEYDGMLDSFGVAKSPIAIRDIDQIRYNRLNISYRPVMRLCKAIIQRHSGEIDVTGIANSFSFFIDMAELWEAYLLNILQRHLTGYVVYSPNDTSGQFLVSDSRRLIRPDIVIEKDGRTVAVIDAKYKWYDTIGFFESDGITRGDLHQMTTYIYHYADATALFLGLFVSPCSGNDIHPMTRNKGHRIGVLNLDIGRWDSGDVSGKDMENSELAFVNTLRDLLLSSP